MHIADNDPDLLAAILGALKQLPQSTSLSDMASAVNRAGEVGSALEHPASCLICAAHRCGMTVPDLIVLHWAGGAHGVRGVLDAVEIIEDTVLAGQGLAALAVAAVEATGDEDAFSQFGSDAPHIRSALLLVGEALIRLAIDVSDYGEEVVCGVGLGGDDDLSDEDSADEASDGYDASPHDFHQRFLGVCAQYSGSLRSARVLLAASAPSEYTLALTAITTFTHPEFTHGLGGLAHFEAEQTHTFSQSPIPELLRDATAAHAMAAAGELAALDLEAFANKRIEMARTLGLRGTVAALLDGKCQDGFAPVRVGLSEAFNVLFAPN